MREVERIADQFKRAHEGDAWHGPSLKELLEGVTAVSAAAKPIAGAHSIWELVLHIEAWERVAIRRLAGDPARIYNTEEDWSQTGEALEDAWRSARALLAETNVTLREAVLLLDDSKLGEPILAEMSPTYITLHGVVQHTLYHAGQIALLKKALRLESAPLNTNTQPT
jgi:uncharacterized damage-inducible protein DinB